MYVYVGRRGGVGVGVGVVVDMTLTYVYGHTRTILKVKQQHRDSTPEGGVRKKPRSATKTDSHQTAGVPEKNEELLTQMRHHVTQLVNVM